MGTTTRELYNAEEIEKIREHIKGYTNFTLKSNAKPFFELTKTLVLYCISLVALKRYPLLGVVLHAAACVRSFLILHDCCHSSFFRIESEEAFKNGDRGINKWVAYALEPLSGMTEETWRISHAHHHRIQGNSNEFDSSRTVLSRSDYEKLPTWAKVAYRIIRFPPIFFAVAPLKTFYVDRFWDKRAMSYVFKFGVMMVMYVKLGIDLRYVIAGQVLAGSFGTMLFHDQHQVNEGFWKPFDSKNDDLTWARAQLHGASMLKIPYLLKFVTMGIEYHHIHHLSPRVPSYNLQKCHEDGDKKGLFNKITKVNYVEALKSLWHTIYDEKTEKYTYT